MNLYRISQDENNDYDTYDSAIVAAETEAAARNINPGGNDWGKYGGWCSRPDMVKVELIGVATSGTAPGVVLASFNAG